MDNRFLQDELVKKFDHLTEECAELITAISKMRRWGAYSVDPTIPENDRIANIHWVQNEMADVTKAISRITMNGFTDKEIQEAFPYP